MSNRKRTSLETLLHEPPREPAAPAPVASPRPSAPAAVTVPPPGAAPLAAAPAALAPQARRRVVKQQTVYLPEPVYEQLRRLAFDERVKMHSLLIEGLDRVFRDRGLVPIPDLLREQP